MHHLIGIDIGTTNTKAIAFDLGGHIIARSTRPTPVLNLGNRQAIHDPEDVWSTVVTILTELANKTHKSTAAGICVASIGESGVPLDHNGMPCYPAIAWYDERTLAQSAWWSQELGKKRVFHKTGLSLSHIYSLNKLLWIRDNEPEAYAQVERWLCISDYIAYRLCGEQAMGFSLASRTMAFDPLAATWSDEMLQSAKIPASLWPQPLQEGSLLGTTNRLLADRTGLRQGIPVVVGGHDHVVAALAVGAIEPGVMIDSTGTTETEMVALTSIDDAMTRENATFCLGRHVIRGTYYAIGGILGAGSMIQWMGKLLYGSAESREQSISLLTDAARKSPVGAKGLWILPHMAGRGAPDRDEESKAIICGLSLEHSSAELARATIEGLAFELANLWDALESFTGQATLRTTSVGGGSQNELWTQIKASVTGRTLGVANEPEAVAKGAAMLAGLGTGVWPDAASAVKDWNCSSSLIYPDRVDAQEYAHLRSTLQALRPIAHNLEQQAKSLHRHQTWTE